MFLLLICSAAIIGVFQIKRGALGVALIYFVVTFIVPLIAGYIPFITIPSIFGSMTFLLMETLNIICIYILLDKKFRKECETYQKQKEKEDMYKRVGKIRKR